MKSRLNRRDLFSLLARPFQERSADRIRPKDSAPQPKQDQPRVAVIQGRHCLALTSFCAVCVERCPVPGAMRLVNGMPMVVPDACTGCAVCHQVCPAPTNAVLMLPRRRMPRGTPALAIT